MMKNKDMLARMILLATQRHEGQFDKAGQPYILHPLTVMMQLNTDDEELQCIAIGHDLLEDTKTTAIELKELKFTDRIIDAIITLTKHEGQTYEEYKMAVKSNHDAVKIKKEDLRHNSDIRRLKGVTEKDILRMERYHKFFLELNSL